ncbi:hypothetical protein H4S01_000596 [Coemansia sp. RSA 2610]|nr:hypothetical protein H4S01_000596 [Coemansia sp. RSA 2610]
MASIDSLPYDLIDVILRQVVNRSIRTPGDWSLLLRFLAICPSWRAVAKHMVCDTGIIELSQDFRVKALLSNCDNIAQSCIPFTNLRLIEQSGSQTMVRRLIIFDRRTESNSAPVLSLIAISLSLSGCPGISVLRQWYDAMHMRLRIKESLRMAFCATADEIVSTLTNCFPYVTSLKFDVRCAHGTQRSLYTGIIDGYSHQLNELESFIPDLGPQLEGAVNLTSLDLDLTGLPKVTALIYPQSLKALTLRVGPLNSFWNVLHGTKASGPIKFDNLESLSLLGNNSHINLEQQNERQINNPGSLSLEMPRLLDLHVQDVFLTRTEIVQLLKPSLKRVHCRGPALGAVNLCRHINHMLDELVVEFKLEDDASHRRQFVRYANELFRHSLKAINVYCSLDTLSGQLNYSQLSWKHVTHLELQTGDSYENIIPAVATFSNLVYLSILRVDFGKKEEDEEISWLESIKSLELEPLESRIEELVLLLFDHTPSKDFSNSLENLKGYLPKLKAIEIPDC